MIVVAAVLAAIFVAAVAVFVAVAAASVPSSTVCSLNRTVKVLPCPGTLSSLMEPPIRVTSCLTMANPRPVPKFS